MAGLDSFKDTSVSVTASESTAVRMPSNGIIRRVRIKGTNTETVTIRAYADSGEADQILEVAFTLDGTDQESEVLQAVGSNGIWVTHQGGGTHALTKLVLEIESDDGGEEFAFDY